MCTVRTGWQKKVCELEFGQSQWLQAVTILAKRDVKVAISRHISLVELLLGTRLRFTLLSIAFSYNFDFKLILAASVSSVVLSQNID